MGSEGGPGVSHGCGLDVPEFLYPWALLVGLGRERL